MTHLRYHRCHAIVALLLTSSFILAPYAALAAEIAPTAPAITADVVDAADRVQQTGSSVQTAATPVPAELLTYEANATTREVQNDPKQTPRIASVDESSGALTYGYAFTLPPGRGAIAPNLALTYSSSNRRSDSIVGVGFDISLPRIERVNTRGTDVLYAGTDFSSSIDGTLEWQGGTEYVAVSESGEKHSYTYAQGSWVMVDGQGTRYFFGKTAGARQDDPLDPTRVYGWRIEEIRDTNDNYVRFEYIKDAGQIYPKRIVYVGQGATDGIYSVDFTLESYTTTATQYATDFPVRTDYRVKQVTVSVLGSWVRRYDLAYVPSDNGYRSLLASITETARRDGIELTREPTTFSYQARGPIRWQEASSSAYRIPMPTMEYHTTQPPSFAQLRDITGDGYVDQVQSGRSRNSPCGVQQGQAMVADTKGGWLEMGGCYAPWELPLIMKDYTYSRLDAGVRIFDYNGDLLPDVVRAVADTIPSVTTVPTMQVVDVHKHNPSGETGWTPVASTTIPVGFVFGSTMGADAGTEVVDVNGDGLQDIVYGWLDDDGSGLLQRVYLGDGSGSWKQSSSTVAWQFPYYLIDENENGPEFRAYTILADVNGDGLSDVLYRKRGQQGQFINNGHSWLADDQGTWNIPFYTEYAERTTTAADAGARVTDVNGDGVLDVLRLWKHGSLYLCTAYINTQNERADAMGAFTETPCENTGEYFASDGSPSNVMVIDVNADGVDDLVLHQYDANANVDTSRVRLGQGTPFTDLLIGATETSGASFSAQYKMSTNYRTPTGALANPQLPILLPTVASLAVRDGMGTTATTTYDYADGSYYYRNPVDRKFAGFGSVRVADALGTVTTTYYHQGNGDAAASEERGDAPAKMGKPYRVETRDKDGALLSLVVNTWGLVPRVGRAAFVPLATTTTLTYDGNSSHRDTATEYTYTPTGYPLSESAWGEVVAQTNGTFVDKGSDARITTYAYATNTAEKYALRSMETVTDLAGNTLSRSRRMFDGLPYGFIAKGNVTRLERLLLAPSTYVASQKTYNLYGLVTSSTDERGNITRYTPDAFNLYPATIENALGQRTTVVYDYASGKPVSITDPNSLRKETSYDPLDRVVEERVPDTADASRLVPKTQYVYTDTGMSRSVLARNVLDEGVALETTTYLDGLGRALQSRTRVSSGQYRVSDTVYDVLGRVVMQSLPYLSSGVARTEPTTDDALKTVSTYDALGRPLSVRTALGTSRMSYDDWVTRTTDPLGRVKAVAMDAFGQVATVVEQNAGIFYYTQYVWSPLGQLTKITDAAKNVRAFAYDLLGRRTAAEDLHAPADTTFGTWRYEYDAAGNLTKTTSPRGVVVIYTYDALNRVKTEDTPLETGVEATYIYDTPTTNVRSIGKLSSVVSPQVTTGYAYDTQGRMAGISRTYPGQSTQYFWHYLDRQGNPRYRYYPDASWVEYGYNPEGQLQTVTELEPGASAWGTLISSIAYAPAGQVSRMTYGTGVIAAATTSAALLTGSGVTLAAVPLAPMRSRVAVPAASTSTLSVASNYDAQKLYRLASRVGSFGTTTLQSIAYTYDAVGNIKTLDDTSVGRGSKSVVYGYDDLNRLTSASTTRSTYDAPYAQSFTYSPIGNILTRSGVQNLYQGSGGASYANPHAPTFTAGLALTYDNDGNLLTWGTTYTNTWDYKNRLSSSSYLAPSATTKVTQQYIYDYAGARVSATTASTTTLYPFPEVSKTSGSSINTIYVGDTPVATIERATGSLPKTHYPLTDHLGSVTMVVAPSGMVEQTLDYFPYGQMRFNKTPKYSSPRTYIGEYGDPTALSYLNARYYDGRRGVFLSQDPLFWNPSKELLLDPQQMNSYSYARNNPISQKDPSGLSVAVSSGTWSTGLQDSATVMDNLHRLFPGQDIVPFDWSREDNDASRQQGAQDFVKFADKLKADHGPSDPLNIVCHSHGCNVVALYSQMKEARHIDTLLGFGAPMRDDYSYNETNISKHVNVYSRYDLIQSNGGGALFGSSFFAAGLGSSWCGLPCAASGFVVGAAIGWMEFGSARRAVEGATNVDATGYTSIWHPIANHSNLYKNQDIWSNLVESALK